MPELPEVETVMRGLRPLIVGKTIVQAERLSPTLRTPLPANLSAQLKNQTITRLTRRAKYILATLSGGKTILVHLGMTGGFFVRDGGKIIKHDHIVLHLANGMCIAFHDPRRFGQFEILHANDIDKHPSLCDLGPEPLDEAFTWIVLRDAIAKKKTSIKAALLDQRVVAGLGNIYVSEALHMAGIHPESTAGSISPARIKKLHAAIVKVLHQAIAAGGSTLKDYRQPNGELGFFQDKFMAYGRAGEVCKICGPAPKTRHKIVRIVQNGRSTFYCPGCQR